MSEDYGGLVTVHEGDCIEVMRGMPDASVDAVVCDPPYNLSFMSRSWDDYGTPAAYARWCESWAAEAYRVLKPGGHLLAFGGTRTWHRLTCGIEDAGFEIRDTIAHFSGTLYWIYGSGFPKSLNVSKDARFCQCMSGVQETTAEPTSEPTAEVLLTDMHGSGPDERPNPASLRDLRGAVHPNDSRAGGTELDLFADLHGEGNQSGKEREAIPPRRAPSDPVRAMRPDRAQVTEPPTQDAADVLHAPLPGASTRLDASGKPARSDGPPGNQEIRSGQPGVEGRGDLRQTEGQLHRAALRTMPAGPDGDGALGRVRDGASPRDGSPDQAPVAALGSRGSRGPQPAQQRGDQPAALSVERGSQAGRGWPLCGGCGKPVVPAGLGTALKPASEPIVVARKPLTGTVAQSVLTHGTGALNIDGCRVESLDGPRIQGAQKATGATNFGGEREGGKVYDLGRWPANVVLSHVRAWDGADACAGPGGCVPGCPVAELDQQSGERPGGNFPQARTPNAIYGGGKGTSTAQNGGARSLDDSGGASRFFPTFRYTAKAPTSERPRIGGGPIAGITNNRCALCGRTDVPGSPCTCPEPEWIPRNGEVISHATVKPLDLMRWLVRLVVPTGAVVLDPFLGSGTTAEACVIEGMRCIGIEQDHDHVTLIRKRLHKPIQPTLDF